MYYFGRMMDLERKLEEFEPTVTTKFYKGRPTRKYIKLLRLQQLCYGTDMMTHMREMTTKMNATLAKIKKR